MSGGPLLMRQVADGKKLILCREVFTPDGAQPPARGENLKKSVFLKELKSSLNIL